MPLTCGTDLCNRCVRTGRLVYGGPSYPHLTWPQQRQGAQCRGLVPERKDTVKKIVLALAMAAGIIAPLAAAPVASAAAQSTTTYNIWQWNVAGNTLHEGSATDGLVQAAVSSIVNRSADFVSFNELCYGQYSALKTQLTAAGWPADTGNFARWSASIAGGGSVCGGDAYGDAIFSKQPLGAADYFSLPSDGTGENRQMLCAPLAAHVHVRFCSTHITTSNALDANGVKYNVKQLNYVLAQLESYEAAGDSVIIAGDFNAQPNYDRLNAFYSSSVDTVNNSDNTGHYHELDDSDAANCPGYGEWTSTGTPGATPPCGGEAKIDEIFVRENHISGSYSADSLAIPTTCAGMSACSDHRVLTGTVSLTYTP